MDPSTLELSRPRAEPRRLPWSGLILFMAGSFFVHGGAFAALGSLEGDVRVAEPALPPEELSFTVVAPVEPSPPEPVQAAPVPRPLVATRAHREPPKQVDPAPTPTAAAAEPPPVQTLGVSSEEGLGVAGAVGPGAPVAGTSLTGALGGTGTTPAPAAPPTPQVDLKRLIGDWTALVRKAINERASREYPRSALRAHVQGAVMLKVRVGTSGRVELVELAQSSGHGLLDEAALAAARAVGEVPAPPPALHRYLRPFPVPVNYVIR